MADLPFWSDDFDMDFPRIFPEARVLLGPLADIELWTVGHETHGRLNHPAVWNGDRTMLAFFRFDRATKLQGECPPPGYYAGRDPLVCCTAWEMFRDAWPHHYGVHVDGRLVWDTLQLDRHFETIMYHVRGWRTDLRESTQAQAAVMRSYRRAIATFRSLVQEYGANA